MRAILLSLLAFAAFAVDQPAVETQPNVDHAKQIPADIAAIDAKVKTAWAEADKYRINPTPPGGESPPEWITGTPEYKEREAKMTKLMGEAMALEKQAKAMRDITAANNHEGIRPPSSR